MKLPIWVIERVLTIHIHPDNDLQVKANIALYYTYRYVRVPSQQRIIVFTIIRCILWTLAMFRTVHCGPQLYANDKLDHTQALQFLNVMEYNTA